MLRGSGERRSGSDSSARKSDKSRGEAPALSSFILIDHRNGPKTSKQGMASMAMDAIHQADAESRFFLESRPLIPITIPTRSEMKTIAKAKRPRGAQPISDTGVKYRPTMESGATEGITICQVNALMPLIYSF